MWMCAAQDESDLLEVVEDVHNVINAGDGDLVYTNKHSHWMKLVVGIQMETSADLADCFRGQKFTCV